VKHGLWGHLHAPFSFILGAVARSSQIEMLEEHILPPLNGLCCQRTYDDDERLGLCGERTISEGKIETVQYVNRRQGCGLVQFSLFFLLKTWHLVMKMNHMQLLPMGWLLG
jgi:hypothetical protein